MRANERKRNTGASQLDADTGADVDASQLDADTGAENVDSASDAENVDVDSDENASSADENSDADSDASDAENDSDADSSDDSDSDASDADVITPATDNLRETWTRVALSAASAGPQYVALSITDVDAVTIAFRELARVVTKTADRLSIVRELAETLGKQFFSERNLDAMGASQDIAGVCNELAAAKTGARVVDQKRENALRFLVAEQLWLTLDADTSDDEKAFAKTIPSDDSQRVVLFDRVFASLTKTRKTAQPSDGPKTPRAASRDFGPLIAGAVTPVFQTVQAIQKAIGSEGGAVGNVWLTMNGITPGTKAPRTPRVIAGVRAIEQDGKKGFIAG